MEHIIYKGNKYKRTAEGYYLRTERLHRTIWEDHFGQIPEKHHIHHKNGIKDDNRIENLECISEVDHPNRHFDWKTQVDLLHKGRDAATRWHKSEEGALWHMQQQIELWSKRGHLPRKCVICSKIFKSRCTSGPKYCSKECRKKGASFYIRDKIFVLCLICRKKFQTVKRKKHARACSPSCGATLAAKVKREQKNDVIPPVV